MKLKELLQSIKDEYATLVLERPDGLNNQFMDEDRYNDEDILRQLENEHVDDQEEPEEQMEGDE
jgi:hypothetical protein